MTASVIRRVALFGLLLAACEEPFEPLQESDRYFSMYGTLDLSADTQWIRVMPVRTSILTDPEPIDATVILEHLGTGRTVQLRDSLVRYPTADPGAAKDRWAHNFWTTEPLQPEATYRVTVHGSSGASSIATVTMPPIPERVVIHIDWPPSTLLPREEFIRVDGVQHLAMVHVVHHFPPECESIVPTRSVYQPGSRVSSSGGAPRVTISRWTEMSLVCPAIHTTLPDWGPGEPDLFDPQFFDVHVVVSGDSWPFDSSVDPGTFTHVDVASNVENGVGFVGGIHQLSVPFDYCRMADVPQVPESCELVFDEHSALLIGHVTDSRCSDRPIRNVAVQVIEVGGFRTWIAYSDLRGWFRIGGLRAETEYEIVVDAGGFPGIRERLRFDPGEHRTYNIRLNQTGQACPAPYVPARRAASAP